LEQRDQGIKNLINTIEHEPTVWDLARIPLLLAVIVLVYRANVSFVQISRKMLKSAKNQQISKARLAGWLTACEL